jgi:segregation and condensation protein B
MEDKTPEILEALIFASDTPLSINKIKEILEDIGAREIRKAIEILNKRYESTNSSLMIIEVAGGFQMVTRPEFADYVARLYKNRQAHRLTQKALETLAIIAYKQPITKQEIEHIRGVTVDSVIRTLIERNLITVVGREKAPGNPLLYGTTKEFLEYFGLNSLEDLPKLKEIDELLKDDEKFLESLDQVALERLAPEELGIVNTEDTASEPSEAETTQNEQNEEESQNVQSNETETSSTNSNDAL